VCGAENSEMAVRSGGSRVLGPRGGRRSKGECDIAFLVGRKFLLAKTGLFWRVLEPVSGSLESLAVAPAAFSGPPMRSIPSPPFKRIELRRIRLPWMSRW
jgi:hypothetical protein